MSICLHKRLKWSYFLPKLVGHEYELHRDKTNNVAVCPAKTQISLGICPVRPESSLSAWRKLGSLATHWAHREDSDQTGWMPRLIGVFAGCTLILLVLSWGSSYNQNGYLYKTDWMHNWATTWQNQQSDCAPSEDSDQPGHLPSLISLCCPHEESLGP